MLVVNHWYLKIIFVLSIMNIDNAIADDKDFNSWNTLFWLVQISCSYSPILWQLCRVGQQMLHFCKIAMTKNTLTRCFAVCDTWLQGVKTRREEMVVNEYSILGYLSYNLYLAQTPELWNFRWTGHK